MCDLFYHHLNYLYGGMITRTQYVCNHRRLKDGRVDYSLDGGPGRKWSVFQLDRSYGGIFCACPQPRRKRLGQQVVMVKSFWDMSTRFKGRRLESILERTKDAYNT